MCSSSKPKTPKVEAAPVAPVVVSPIEADTSSRAAGEEERRRRKAASGRSDTILTGGSGLDGSAMTGGKKLLGE